MVTFFLFTVSQECQVLNKLLHTGTALFLALEILVSVILLAIV